MKITKTTVIEMTLTLTQEQFAELLEAAIDSNKCSFDTFEALKAAADAADTKDED